MSGGLTDAEIVRIVNRYIGVSGGYLGLPDRFTYRTHADFYAEYCDLSVDLSPFEGTTRETFMAALASLSSRDQAKVLRGLSERFPPDELGAPTSRPTSDGVLLSYIERLESGPLVASLTPQITSDVVLRALQDFENLVQTSRPTSAVDRVHTLLHGYLIAVCDSAGVARGERETMVALLRKLEAGHPKLADLGPRAQDIKTILTASASILDALLPVRNQASVAHPNAALLGEDEARLIIHVGRTLLNYLDAKLS
ncbi:MAG: abortive infection family protein [Acidimicrobiales bacterium]